ncbi:MAG: hypothetical protein DSY80_05840 [Desulfocapsa sp.]|nr:MAG: hypothetical protein DSY80_05840 [Desulfocapsa sp.]
MVKQIMVISQKPLFDESGARILDVPKGAVLKSEGVETRDGAEYIKTQYREYSGYLRSDFTDPYKNRSRKAVVKLDDIQTDDPHDPAQFVIWQNTSGKEIICLNQCGEICVSRVVKKPLSETLAMWRDSGSWHYSHVFQQSEKDRGTDEAALTEMLHAVGVENVSGLSAFFSVDGYPLYTSYRFSQALKRNWIIYGVSINQVTGELVTNKQIAHWILLDRIAVSRTGGTVRFYNPFQNEYQQNSWEFLQLSAQAFSADGFSGLVVPRQRRNIRKYFEKHTRY